MVGGVLAGLGEYLNIDATLVRVIYAALAIFTSFFPAFVLYIIAMIVIPEEPVATVVDELAVRGRRRPRRARRPHPRAAPPVPPAEPPAPSE